MTAPRTNLDLILDPEPELDGVVIEFIDEVDRSMARATRERISRELEEPGTIAAAGHFPDLVFGRMLVGEGRQQLRFDRSQVIGG